MRIRLTGSESMKSGPSPRVACIFNLRICSRAKDDNIKHHDLPFDNKKMIMVDLAGCQQPSPRKLMLESPIIPEYGYVKASVG